VDELLEVGEDWLTAEVNGVVVVELTRIASALGVDAGALWWRGRDPSGW
jgi:hypothetical protein